MSRNVTASLQSPLATVRASDTMEIGRQGNICWILTSIHVNEDECRQSAKACLTNLPALSNSLCLSLLFSTTDDVGWK